LASPATSDRARGGVSTVVHSRLGRRLVLLFVLCAVVPIVSLAAVVYMQLTSSLQSDSRARLHETSRSVGIELAGRLHALDAELDLLAASADTWVTGAAVPPQLLPRLRDRFVAITVTREGVPAEAMLGALLVPELSGEQQERLRSGSPLLVTEPAADGSRIILVHPLPQPNRGLLLAEVAPEPLWGRDLWPAIARAHVVAEGETLFGSTPAENSDLDQRLAEALTSSGVGTLEWTADGEPYLAAYWAVPLRFSYGAAPWTVVTSEPKAVALAPTRRAGQTFALVGLLSFWIVLALSLWQIRKCLVPLTRLQAGTRRVGGGTFDEDVIVTSGDEFEELAGSFNTMSHRVKRQIDDLAARSDLDRAVLSSLDVSTIVRTVLDRLPSLVECHATLIRLTDPRTPGATLVFTRCSGQPVTTEAAAPSFTPHEEHALTAAKPSLHVARPGDMPSFLAPFVDSRWSAALVLPLSHAGREIGFVALAGSGPHSWASENVARARQLADQLAVALANANLVEALDRLNVGTLNALARTVDAKSPWTAGHSQRVAHVAVELGRVLGLCDFDIDTLKRGSLLHDIGKIAVPSAILNKPGKLTDEEFALMKAHPETGARILEPIPEYGRYIPIVLQHHERFDGSGYPHGVAGNAISFDARIVAVADVWDALTSRRPYRDSLTTEQATRIILESKSTHFDPRVVEAFEQIVTDTARIHLSHVA
jgi:putative nucleotidyltransferase with HDIG domain